MGRNFTLLWTAYAASTAGTYLALDAFPLIALLVLDSSALEISLLAAAGTAVGALIALPSGPWVEFRRKRPVMIGTDLVRFGALASLPLAFATDALTFGHLVGVAIAVAASDIAFMAASGAYLKALVRPADLLTASSRFESTLWTATALGPPLGGWSVGAFGPLTTVVLNGVSYLLSATGIAAIRDREPQPPARPAPPGSPRAGAICSATLGSGRCSSTQCWSTR
ncbi:hypothetical protein GCM10020369_48350 [Cryptosporangium minutisporangium]|uniref:MFS transporter n=1 Tax=Cryptosporangium minutisporangium TaxID=113569 RepID=A0ABP6T247_9ACTN